jgi:hypothetical protein
MTPQEEALLQRVEGQRREELRLAFEILARIRQEHPGIDDPQQLPPAARAEALAALSAMRRVVDGGGGSIVHTVVSCVLLLVAAGLLWLKPATIYRCAPQAEGQARCVVSQRLLGFVPLSSRAIEGIAGASRGTHRQSSEDRDSNGRTRTTSTTVEDLELTGADGRELLRVSESHLLGASLGDLASKLQVVFSGYSTEPVVCWNTVWPVLLLATPFALIAVSHLSTLLGLWLMNHELIPMGVYRIAFYWAPSVVMLVLFAGAWVFAYLGSNPPAWLVRVLGI